MSQSLFTQPLNVINVGIAMFSDDLKKQHVDVVQLDWTPPGQGNMQVVNALDSIADSPLAELADIVLPLQGAETSFIYKPTAARYGMLLAIDVLATELALASPEDNQERLRRIKLALDEYRGGDDHLPLGD